MMTDDSLGASCDNIKGEKACLHRVNPRGLHGGWGSGPGWVGTGGGRLGGAVCTAPLPSEKYIFITISQMRHFGPRRGGHTILGTQG